MSLGISSGTNLGVLNSINTDLKKAGVSKDDSSKKTGSAAKTAASDAATYTAKSSSSDAAVKTGGLSYLGRTEKTSGLSQANEAKLSKKAQAYLEKLRDKYKDYDLYVGNTDDEKQTLAKAGNKEFSVIFSSEELEKMADDEKYASEKLKTVETAVDMSREISKKYGFDKDLISENGQINKIGISVNDDGTVTMFAELQKMSDRQKARIEEARAKKAAEADGRVSEKKASGKKASVKEEKDAAGKATGVSDEDADATAAVSADKAADSKGLSSYEDLEVKTATVTAGNVDDLLSAIKGFDWSTVEAAKTGDRIDFSA